MKKLALVLALTLTAFAGSAFAQWDDNNVGLYFDMAGTSNCGSVDAGSLIYTYLVFTNLTSPDVKSWEINLAYDNVDVVSLVPYYDHILVSPRQGDVMVGLSTPQLAVGGTFLAARIRLLVDTPDPAGVTPNGVFFHLLETKVPAYINGAGDEFAMRSIAPTGEKFLVINSDCTGVVGTETTSFGEVKSLFR